MTQEGIHSISAESYRLDPCEEPSLSASIAVILDSKSPRHAWLEHPRLNPNYTEDEETRFDIGSAAHALLLEGENRIRVLDFSDYKTNASKIERAAARLSGKIPLLEKHADAVHAMRDAAIRAIDEEGSEVCGILDHGKAEQTIVWRDAEEVLCRSRLDWLTDANAIVLDLKTTTNANIEACIRQVFRMGYDIKADFYLRGVAAETRELAKFVWMFQEIDAPYECCFIGAGPQMLALAAQKVDRAMGIWQRCLEANHWPGYSRRIAWAEPPPWEEMRWHEQRAMEAV